MSAHDATVIKGLPWVLTVLMISVLVIIGAASEAAPAPTQLLSKTITNAPGVPACEVIKRSLSPAVPFTGDRAKLQEHLLRPLNAGVSVQTVSKGENGPRTNYWCVYEYENRALPATIWSADLLPGAEKDDLVLILAKSKGGHLTLSLYDLTQADAAAGPCADSKPPGPGPKLLAEHTASILEVAECDVNRVAAVVSGPEIYLQLQPVGGTCGPIYFAVETSNKTWRMVSNEKAAPLFPATGQLPK